MTRCTYHPDVETEMRCAECEKPICPKEMVLTPVGYKCPECARPARSQYAYVKPKQMLLAAAAGLGVGVLGGFIVGATSFGGFLLGIVWGGLTAEAVRRASGGHRGGVVGTIAALSIVAGWFAGSLTGYVGLLTVIIAVVVALVQLAVIGRN